MSIQDWDEVLKQKEAIINDECFIDMWNVDAIKYIALDYNYDDDDATWVEYQLSTELAKQVIVKIKDHYDPNFGVFNMSIFGDIESVVEKHEGKS